MIVNIEYCTGHIERHAFVTREAAQGFLVALCNHVEAEYPDDKVTDWLRRRERLSFRFGSCEWNLASLHDGEEVLPPVEFSCKEYEELAAQHGGVLVNDLVDQRN